MNKITRTSVILKKVFGFLAPIPVFFLIYLWVSASYQPFHILGSLLGYSHLSVLHTKYLNITVNIVGMALFLPLFATQTYWLWELKKLFTSYAQGEIFTEQNSTYLHHAAIAFLSITIFAIFIDVLFIQLLTINSVVEYRLLLINSAIVKICNLLLSIVLIVLSWVMDEGRRLKEDCDLTI